MGYCWYCINYVYWSDLSPRCWAIVASFYVERRRITSLRKRTIANVRKKNNSLCSKISEHVLSYSHHCLSLSRDETVANAGIFPLKTYLVLMMKKGISYSSSSLLCLYLWRVRKSNFSSCPLPPASPSAGKLPFISLQPLYWVNGENVFSGCSQIRSQWYGWIYTPTSALNLVHVAHTSSSFFLLFSYRCIFIKSYSGAWHHKLKGAMENVFLGNWIKSWRWKWSWHCTVSWACVK